MEEDPKDKQDNTGSRFESDIDELFRGAEEEEQEEEEQPEE